MPLNTALKRLARLIAQLATGVAIAAAVVCTSLAPASATEGPWEKTPQSQARLVSATEAVGDAAELKLGIEFELNEGWKTYWRSPGDAGLPPSVDWAGSENFKSATLSYPAPRRFEVLGLQTLGYSHRVIFPIAVELRQPGQAFIGRAQFSVLICEKICIPQSFNLTISLPAGKAMPGSQAQQLNRFQSAVPKDGRTAGLSLEETTATQRADGIEVLQVVAKSQDRFTSPDIFAEVKPELAFGRPEMTLSADGTTATFTVPLSRVLPPGTTLAGQPVVLTLVDGTRAAEFNTRIVRGSGQPLPAYSDFQRLAVMIGIAFLGGVILNFMPCVLPILSIKVVSFAQEAGRHLSQIRAGMLATAAGILTSMLLIAALLIAMKNAGIAIGWGIQFQQPLFVAAMALILTLFACNFWGLFEITLPGSVSNMAVAAGGDDKSIASNFLVGAFATLLATPCSAPFVGTAVGFALGQGALQIVSIFAALGLGLALPYLAVAAFPSVVRFMPRPGQWMVWLRRIMGVGLALTAGWLLVVLAGEIGSKVASLVALALVLIAVCFAAARFLPRMRPALLAAVAGLGLSTVLAGGLAARVETAGDGSAERIAWQPLQQDQIKSLVAQGKTVFVEVTADWCLTCKANKRLVLERSPLLERIVKDTIAMRGDWTSPDPKITEFLASFGKYGVPFNVVYGPGSPAGIPLPELLTQQAVTAAIDKAAGTAVERSSNNGS